MSGATPTRIPTTEGTTVRRAVAHAVRTAAVPVQAVGFWTAIALPFVYLPLLVDGVTGDGALLAALIAVNVVALVAGHGYDVE